MQTVSSIFTANSKKEIRKLFWRCYISFMKEFDANITFFSIGESTIGGTDFIKGEGNVVQEWNKYAYENYTNRVISFEYVREQDPYLGGGVLSMADIVLDNHDGLFTPNHPNSHIRNNILPWRPVRLYAGFENEGTQVFVGLMEGMPDINDKNKTVKIHCIDYMQALFNYPLDESLILQDQTTDSIMGTLLELAGLSSSQYELDEGFNIVPFFFAKKGEKLGKFLRGLAGSELGRIYMDEDGVIKFVNRSNWTNNTDISWEFDRSNIIDKKTTGDDKIINVVEVKSAVREVTAKQKFWEQAEAKEIPAGGTEEIWADFPDPVTSADDPEYVVGATTSLYTTNEEADGSGANRNGNITLDSTDTFGTSFKMTFSNNHTSPVFITTLEVFATPAKITKNVYARVQDDASVASFDEKPKTIVNNFIQDDSLANSLAQIIVSDNKDFNEIRSIDVVGVPQLQIGDLVSIGDELRTDTYFVTKIVGRMVKSKFVQKLTVVNKTINTYFRTGVSTVGSDDQIAP